MSLVEFLKDVYYLRLDEIGIEGCDIFLFVLTSPFDLFAGFRSTGFVSVSFLVTLSRAFFSKSKDALIVLFL